MNRYEQRVAINEAEIEASSWRDAASRLLDVGTQDQIPDAIALALLAINAQLDRIARILDQPS